MIFNDFIYVFKVFFPLLCVNTFIFIPEYISIEIVVAEDSLYVLSNVKKVNYTAIYSTKLFKYTIYSVKYTVYNIQ